MNNQNEKIDYAINVDVPDENIINRMGGRRADRQTAMGKVPYGILKEDIGSYL